MAERSIQTMEAPAIYRIQVYGHLEDRWSTYLQGLQIEKSTEPGLISSTTLTGWLADQAALLGVLNTLYNLAMPLISVEFLALDEESPKKETHDD